MNITIVILFFAIVLFAAISLLSKFLRTKRYLGRNTAKWIFAIYCALLFASVAVFYLIPDKGFLYPEKEFLSQKGFKEYVARERIDIVKAAQENRLTYTDGIFLLGKIDFLFQEEELEVAVNEEHFYIPVIVKRKEDSDGQIEAALFSTKIFYNNIDLSDKIKLPEMELLGSKLRLTNLDNEIKMINFRKAFIVAQFSNSDSYQPTNIIHLEWGQKVLYLQIPNNVQVKSRQLDVQFVGE